MENKKRILVVDDEKNIRELVRKYAEFEGYEVDESADGMDAAQKCKNKKFDIVILDVMLPFLDGFSVCKEIRKTGKTPVIMLSARGEEYDRIHGFEVGADDYIVKPFSPKELMMRVAAVLSRVSENTVQKSEVLCLGGIEIDRSAHIVKIDGEKTNLTPKEYELLDYFASNPGIALSRRRLIEDIWGYEFDGDDRTLDTHIKLLRHTLGKYSECIVTVRGMGYRFDACQ